MSLFQKGQELRLEREVGLPGGENIAKLKSSKGEIRKLNGQPEQRRKEEGKKRKRGKANP